MNKKENEKFVLINNTNKYFENWPKYLLFSSYILGTSDSKDLIKIDVACMKNSKIYSTILEQAYEDLKIKGTKEYNFLQEFYKLLNRDDIIKLFQKGMTPGDIFYYSQDQKIGMKDLNLTKDEILSFPLSVNKIASIQYITDKWPTEDIIKYSKEKKIVCHLNKLFRTRQLTKEQLIGLLDSPEFTKKGKVLSSSISIREASLRSMVKQQNACDGTIINAFYDKFSKEDEKFTIECLQFIKKNKTVIKKVKNGMREDIQLILELI